MTGIYLIGLILQFMNALFELYNLKDPISDFWTMLVICEVFTSFIFFLVGSYFFRIVMLFKFELDKRQNQFEGVVQYKKEEVNLVHSITVVT